MLNYLWNPMIIELKQNTGISVLTQVHVIAKYSTVGYY